MSRVVVRVTVRVVEAAMGRAATVALREAVRKPTRLPLLLAAMHSLWLPSLGPLSVAAARFVRHALSVINHTEG